MNTEFLNEADLKPFFSMFFDNAPDLFVFGKDLDYRFILMNKVLLKRLNLNSESEVIGKRDEDFFEANITELFRREDREVFESRKPVISRTWNVPNGKGGFDWYISSKYPIIDKNENVSGLIGVMRGITQASNMLEPYADLTPVITYIQNNYSRQIEISTLAELMHLSVSQFERRFKKLVNMTPLRFINKTRIDKACEKLIRSNDTLSSIALECGFFDHSYFSKIFKKHMNMTPAEYRKRYYSVK